MVLSLDFEPINREEDTGPWPEDAGSQEDKEVHLGVAKFARVLE